jgi:hypothetical protein
MSPRRSVLRDSSTATDSSRGSTSRTCSRRCVAVVGRGGASCRPPTTAVRRARRADHLAKSALSMRPKTRARRLDPSIGTHTGSPLPGEGELPRCLQECATTRAMHRGWAICASVGGRSTAWCAPLGMLVEISADQVPGGAIRAHRLRSRGHASHAGTAIVPQPANRGER